MSIFLRKLEYFQGILFLTTNRVATFDDAFQSRIHIGLGYDKLDIKAKKGIWKYFLDRVKALPDVEVADITEDEFTKLSNFDVNAREVQDLPPPPPTSGIPVHLFSPSSLPFIDRPPHRTS